MIRLLIVDDHTMMRQLLVEELSALEEFEVVGDMSTGEEALSRAQLLRPDCIMLDISLPGRDGIEIAADMRSRGISTPILCLTMHLNNHIMRRAIQAGINGYAVKHDTFDDLVKAIKAVVSGQRYVSPLLMPSTAGFDDGPSASDNDLLQCLSDRERQIVSLVADGKTTGEIAGLLSISERTVDFHRRNVGEKTGLRRIAEITRFAVRTGLAVDV